MFSALKGLIGSKKFWMLVIGSGLVAGMNQLGLPHDLINTVATLFGVGIAGQGMADFGKEAKK